MTKRYNGVTYGWDKVCPVCGKNYVIFDTDQWVYKRWTSKTMIYFCTYTCKSRYDEQHPRRRGSRWHKKEDDGQ